MRLKKFKAVISAIVMGITCMTGTAASVFAEDNCDEIIVNNEIAETTDEPEWISTGKTNNILKDTKNVTDFLLEFDCCVDGSIDAFEEWGEDGFICGEYVDEVSLHSDDLDIALGFDYKFNKETGVLFITDVYGVVKNVDKTRKPISADTSLYICDNLDFTGLGTVSDMLFSEKNLISSQFMGANGDITSVEYTEKATEILDSWVLPVEKVMFFLGSEYSLKGAYDTLVFTGDGPDRFSFFHQMPSTFTSVKMVGGESHYDFINGMLIDNNTNTLVSMLSGAEYMKETFSNDVDGLKFDNSVVVPLHITTVDMKAFAGCKMDNTTLVLPDVTLVKPYGFDFTEAPDRFIFSEKSCNIRTTFPKNKDIEVFAYEGSGVDEKIADYANIVFKSLGTVLTPDVYYGDVNCDGEVTVADCVSINMYNLSESANPLSAEAFANADVFKDGIVDASDAALLLNYISMLIDYDKLGMEAN